MRENGDGGEAVITAYWEVHGLCHGTSSSLIVLIDFNPIKRAVAKYQFTPKPYVWKPGGLSYTRSLIPSNHTVTSIYNLLLK